MASAPRGLELLAPARNADIAREAILHGADAVYIGGPSHGARAAASNSVTDIAALVEWAHLYSARVYVTLNTIILPSELEGVRRTVEDLYRIGVDALIVQDMAVTQLDIPPIDLHASTQCDIRSVEKAVFLADCGFSQLVLPRELSLDEIISYRRALPPDVNIETFVHGALCVSYSGDCQASYAACGRSANRGECAQICRLPYSLTDADGRELIHDKHLLSLRDLCRINDLGRLAAAGVSSFKIEGRLKDASYVKTVVAAYSRALDALIHDNPGLYSRSSAGVARTTFTPDVNKAFNRGFTSYFFDGPVASGTKMANFDTPKWVGERVATVSKTQGNHIIAQIEKPLNNGDGLGFFTPEGRFSGFRLNRIDGSRLFPAAKLSLKSGTVLYRNSDTRLEATLQGNTATRLVPVDITLDQHTSSDDTTTFTLSISDDYGHKVQTDIRVENSPARAPQTQARAKTLTKFGDTILSPRSLTDKADPMLFVPLSAITSLRRHAAELFIKNIKATYRFKYRRPQMPGATLPDTKITRHDNVANPLAEKFYTSHGATSIQPAIETIPTAKIPHDSVVMTTRYCLRRELGACLRSANAKALPATLMLKNKNTTYRLEFDCVNCCMKLHQQNKQK